MKSPTYAITIALALMIAWKAFDTYRLRRRLDQEEDELQKNRQPQMVHHQEPTYADGWRDFFALCNLYAQQRKEAWRSYWESRRLKK